MHTYTQTHTHTNTHTALLTCPFTSTVPWKIEKSLVKISDEFHSTLLITEGNFIQHSTTHFLPELINLSSLVTGDFFLSWITAKTKLSRKFSCSQLVNSDGWSNHASCFSISQICKSPKSKFYSEQQYVDYLASTLPECVSQHMATVTNQQRCRWEPGRVHSGYSTLSACLLLFTGLLCMSTTVCNLSAREYSEEPHPEIFFSSMSADVATLKNTQKKTLIFKLSFTVTCIISDSKQSNLMNNFCPYPPPSPLLPLELLQKVKQQHKQVISRHGENVHEAVR